MQMGATVRRVAPPLLAVAAVVGACAAVGLGYQPGMAQRLLGSAAAALVLAGGGFYKRALSTSGALPCTPRVCD